MTEEERRAIARNNYSAQMEMLGYEPDGNPKDMVEVVRCKDCMSYNSYFVKCNKGHNPRPPYDRWFCADGEKDGSQIKRPQKTFWDSLSEADLMEPMHHFEE